jgi:hypothetical protein
LKVHKYLTQRPGEVEAMPRDWGDEWLDCVDEYMRFQGVSGFPVSHDMGTHLIIR